MAETRGRKRKNDLYFGPEEEDAVVRFINSDDAIERNKIYNEFLRDTMNKMVESIIRRYKLHRKGISYEELHSDTLSYLILKSDRFEPEQNKKAFSYYGTICKNYLLGLLIGDDKTKKRNYSFEDEFSSIEERDDLTYTLSDTDYQQSDLISDISAEIKEELDDTVTGGPKKKKLTENERKVGEALIMILDNWETIFENMEGGTKYAKSMILATIRDYTNLNTKDIRVSMKRFKKLYALVKGDKIDDGYL